MTIDPARYDGHTPGPWDVSKSKASWDECDNVRYSLEGNGCFKSADARLIQDAPMLLDKVLELQAEVERLENLAVDRGTEIDNLETELSRLRSLIPVWVTVTDDPATLPEENRSILTKSRIGSNDFVTFYRFGRVLRPGDRWCYAPTPDQTTQMEEQK